MASKATLPYRLLRLVSSVVVVCACGIAESADPLVPAGDEWRYFKGTQEPSDPINAWREVGFDDSGWLSGRAGFGFGDGDDATNLSDMQGNYISVYLRKSFTVGDPSQLGAVTFRIDYDDGFVAYLNGVEVARKGLTGNPPAHTQAASSHEAGDVESFPVTTSVLRTGANVLALQVHNVAVTSSDLSAAPSLVCSGGASVARFGYSPLQPLARGEAATLSLTGSSTFDLAAFSAVVVYEHELLQCTGTSFLGTVWNDADFRSVDDTLPGEVRIGVVEDTTSSGNFVARGEDQLFVELHLVAGNCPGTAFLGFREDLGMNILVDVAAVGHDVIGSSLAATTVVINEGATFVRGNANNSPIDFANPDDPAPASVTLADAAYILYDLFGDGPRPPCMDAADANDSGVYDITDSITIMQYLFNNSQDTVIPPPFATLGEDTGGSLGCDTPSPSIGCN